MFLYYTILIVLLSYIKIFLVDNTILIKVNKL